MSSDKLFVGICPDCGKQKSEEEFKFKYGYRCPDCNKIFPEVWEVDPTHSDQA